MHHRIIIFCLAVLVLSAQVNAAIIWDQPADPSLNGMFSNLGFAGGADDFVLTEQTTLETIAWAGYYSGEQTISDPVAFNIRFFNDNGGDPGLPVDPFFQEYNATVDAIVTGDIITNASGDTPLFSYLFTLPSLTLDPGEYWIGISEADERTTALGDSQWLWARSDKNATSSAFGNPWQVTGGNLALTLTGNTATASIPTPSTIALIGISLVFFGLVASKRRGY